jgi:hypothetical protein
MNFSDLPDNETLRLARELKDLDWGMLAEAQRQILAQTGGRSALDSWIWELMKRQDVQGSLLSSRNRAVLDAFSGAGSTLRPLASEWFISNVQKVAIDAMKGINSTALNQAVREAYSAILISQQHVLRNATVEAVRSLWRPDSAVFQAFRTDAFANTLMEYVRRSAESSEATEEALKELREVIDKKVAALPHGRVSMDALLSIIVAVLIFLANIAYLEIKDHQKAEAKPPLSPDQIERVNKTIERVKTLTPTDDESTYYAVEREVLIRLKPVNRSVPVAALHPNQLVRLVQPNHQWIYVEYFDYIEGLPKARLGQ